MRAKYYPKTAQTYPGVFSPASPGSLSLFDL